MFTLNIQFLKRVIRSNYEGLYIIDYDIQLSGRKLLDYSIEKFKLHSDSTIIIVLLD